MGINLKTSKIRTRARIQILVQCHQMFGNIEAPRHKSEAGSLRFGVHQENSGVALPLWGLTSKHRKSALGQEYR
jgi:hypothetical protein